jgi:diguanylate cyclase (GGDEF)-like protein
MAEMAAQNLIPESDGPEFGWESAGETINREVAFDLIAKLREDFESSGVDLEKKIELLQTLQKLEDRFKEVKEKIRVDEMTGLLDKAGFMEEADTRISEIISQRKREMGSETRRLKSFSLVIVDIDKFKDINDTLGHLGGDEAIKTAAAFLRQRVRGLDIVGRWGGDEMILGMENIDEKTAIEVVDIIRGEIANLSIFYKGREIKITVSIGVADCSSPDIKNTDDLFRAADHALYRAKKAGRNLVVGASQPEKEDRGRRIKILKF